jgi:hypothetical protein
MGGISSEIKILLSGDSWSTERGFTIDQKNQIYFLNKEIEISKYKDQVMAKLEKFYELEDRVRITDSIINKFQGQINSIPSVLRNRFKNWTYCMELFSASDSELFEVSPKYGTIKKIDIQRASNFNSLIKIPKKIFKDAVALNMFHHSSISKRNVYRFKTVEDFNRYSYFQKLLELVELEVFPIRILYIFKLFQAYIRRWREVFIYFKAILLTRKGMPIYEIEEQILSKT